ncbi:DEAD/DEAH box helicase [Candidatus Saccharibacteria bacterium]|nr:DEAD/DEAH box helicase [Candidatus Saccharibacteria bacterium]
MKTTERTPELSSLELMREINHRVPDVEIRDHQLEALDAIADNEKQGNHASLIVMAPGLGKTTVMAADTRRRLLKDPTARGLFLNDNNDILNQAHGRFQTIVGEEFDYGLFSGDGRNFDEVSVLFASFQVMREWHPAFVPDEFKFGAVDEGHHASADTYEPTLRYFDFDHLLGVTATPDRMDVKDIRDIFGTECYSMTLEEAIRQRLLANVDYHIITDEVVEDRRLIDDYGDEYPFSQLDRKIFVPKRDDEIARIIKEKSEKIKGKVKRIVFCSSIEDVINFSEYFENGAAYHSGLSRTERIRTLDSFKTEDGIDTICAVDAFNEGIDVPDANQIIFKRQTGSKRIYLQQLGRGLRRTPAKTRVQVLDFVGNAERLLMVDRVWRDAGVIESEEELLQTTEIDMSFIHFSEQAKRILPLLRSIAHGVYLEGQTVPLGATRLSRLANELDMTPAALRTVATYLKITPESFPTKKGNQILYFKHEDAERIRRASKTIFEKLKK